MIASFAINGDWFLMDPSIGAQCYFTYSLGVEICYDIEDTEYQYTYSTQATAIATKVAIQYAYYEANIASLLVSAKKRTTSKSTTYYSDGSSNVWWTDTSYNAYEYSAAGDYYVVYASGEYVYYDSTGRYAYYESADGYEEWWNLDLFGNQWGIDSYGNSWYMDAESEIFYTDSTGTTSRFMP